MLYLQKINRRRRNSCLKQLSRNKTSLDIFTASTLSFQLNEKQMQPLLTSFKVSQPIEKRINLVSTNQLFHFRKQGNTFFNQMNFRYLF